MSEFTPDPSPAHRENPRVEIPPLVQRLIDTLRRHPKRVVFTEGEDIRVIRTAAQLVKEEVIAPILLGNRTKIRTMAEEAGVPLAFIKIIEPELSSDFGLFCKRVENMARYRTVSGGPAAELVARPHYFGALMVQYGQADALVGGNQALPAAYFRALLNTIKPAPGVSKIFGVSMLMGGGLKNMGSAGFLLLADTGLIPNPTVAELAMLAVETGKLARHFLGHTPHVAMLSHSTKGSAGTPDAKKMEAAASLAREMVRQNYLDMEVDGEVQADVALDPGAAVVKLSNTIERKPADVLIFPNLDAADISMKMLQHLAGAHNYGRMIMGLARPAAQVPRTVDVDSLFGTALAVAVEAIKFHELHPKSDY
ncbi:MAG: phosphate acyltransferase [Verrucomicrobiota bacterium]